MNPKCPYCGGPLQEKIATLPVSARKQRIYDAIVKAGKRGTAQHNLIIAMHATDAMVSASAYGQLRREICELNRVLRQHNQQISGRTRGFYRLLSTGE